MLISKRFILIIESVYFYTFVKSLDTELFIANIIWIIPDKRVENIVQE